VHVPPTALEYAHATQSFGGGETVHATDLLDLLVHVRGGDSDSAALRIALALARRLGARLDGLCVAALPPAAFTVPEAVSMQIEEAEQRRREAQAHAAWYLQQLQRHALDGEWRVAQGDEVPAICHVAASYDLLVLERGPSRGDAPLGFGNVSRCVFGCRRPVLVVPEQATAAGSGRRVVLAWNGSRESALAAHGALPLLRDADTVHVLDGSDDQHGDPLALPALDLPAWLRRHGIDAALQRFEPAGAHGPALLDAVHALDADLVVMGAWGRSRIAEMVLGGVTRHMFRDCDVPMLVAH
jgi:nucleotide-binding universal stress UspA family protein